MPVILIVDDSVTIRQQVEFTLGRDNKFEIVKAENGKDALAALEKTKNVDLIISDINMPGMSGLDLLEKIKADGTYASIPFVLLTTEGSEDKVERAKAAGAKGWITKPFVPEHLLEMATRLTS